MPLAHRHHDAGVLPSCLDEMAAFSPRITRIYTDLLDIQIDKYERYAETFFRPDGLLLYPISAIRFLRPRRLKMVMELSSFKILRVLRISFRVEPLVVMSSITRIFWFLIVAQSSRSASVANCRNWSMYGRILLFFTSFAIVK